jgi:flavin reductase (DIM6/NTAB) family NADH-FMN oxidoreductase RutF
MQRQAIAVDHLLLPPFGAWRRDAFLLTAGDFAEGQYNCMTVGWGGLGQLWDRPVALVGVKPTRLTCDFLERFPTFTLCHFPSPHRKALLYLGTHSGREEDKIAASGLTATASTVVAAPCFAEADLVLECEKLYAEDYRPESLLNKELRAAKRAGAPHRFFFGELRAVLGDVRYDATAERT